MKVLLDSQLLLWAAADDRRLSTEVRRLIDDPQNTLHFSAVSLWEIGIKRGLGRSDFQVDPRLLRRGLVDNGYAELAVTGEHAIAIQDLPALHKDPFDRLLLAQARTEGAVLLTADEQLGRYGDPVRLA